MLQTGESENEILLGNKQLLAIFFVVVLLLGVAFAGGYKLGQGSKKGAVGAVGEVASTSTAPDATGQTHEVPAGGSPEAATPEANAAGTEPGAAPPAQLNTHDSEAAGPATEEPLGTKKHNKPAHVEPTVAPAAPVETRGEFVPQAGQSFLQVAAVGRDYAQGVADVLHKKGFRAHAVPKPGNPKIYRVLIGPLDGAADLNATRESLRRLGFREVITQRY